jgi:Lsr2
MAQTIRVTVTCDMPHDADVESTQTVPLSYTGRALELDVCESHAAELTAKLGIFVTHARRHATPTARRAQQHSAS